MLDAGVRAEVRAVVDRLVDSADAQAREAGKQLRGIFRLWLLAWEDREIDRVSSAGLMPYAADDLVCSLLETDEQLVRDIADGIGPALHLPAGTALERVREALVLGLHLPDTLEVLEEGRFSARHASVIADQWRELVEDAPPGQEAPRDLVQRLAAELVERAPHCTVAQLRAWSRRRRAALPAETHETRHRAARAGRRVWVEHGEDGTAFLHALLDAPTALAGHGPISAEAARELAAGAPSWQRVLTHPVTGAVLDHDRTTYAVPADLRRRLRLRDGTCCFPGCRRRAERCDLDHTVAWQDGGAHRRGQPGPPVPSPPPRQAPERCARPLVGAAPGAGTHRRRARVDVAGGADVPDRAGPVGRVGVERRLARREGVGATAVGRSTTGPGEAGRRAAGPRAAGWLGTRGGRSSPVLTAGRPVRSVTHEVSPSRNLRRR